MAVLFLLLAGHENADPDTTSYHSPPLRNMLGPVTRRLRGSLGFRIKRIQDWLVQADVYSLGVRVQALDSIKC